MRTILALVLAGCAGAGLAAAPGPVEIEARAIEAMLIAPCCFHQQVSVHQSAAAEEIRQDIRRRLSSGETREAILAHYVGRYGTRILAQPPREGFFLTLYRAPTMALIVSAAALAFVLQRVTAASRRRRREERAAARASEELVRAYGDRIDDELRALE